VATHGTSPATRKVPYDPIKDFTPIGMIGATPNVLMVNASLPVKNVREFIDYLKKNPGKVSYGSAGPGSLTHLTAELFSQATGTNMLHVPYKGIAPAISDLLAGQTQALFPGLAAALPHLKGERMRALAVTGRKRHPLLKDVPTMEESGLKGFDAVQWYGVVGPAKMPEAIVKTLSSSLAQVLAQPDMKIKLAAEAIELVQMAPDFFGVFMQVDIQRWSRLAKQRNIHLDS
jgi:tripartite-type tricarboxylate transporter receptor subunit TctC